MVIQMPKQYPILVMVLALYFWPWQLFSGDLPADWLISCITMQIIFVIVCNVIVREDWILPVIIIEAACMMFNILYVAFPEMMSGVHSYIILAALIMELLIITTSLGVINGCAHSGNIQLASNSLWRVRGGVFSLGGNKEGL
jgi:hypothetical protein